MCRNSSIGSRLRRCAAGLAIALCASAVVTAAPVEAQAQHAPARGRGNLIATGKALFDDQRYEESIQTLSAALLRPGTSKQDRIEVYRYLAYNYITLSQMDEAEAAVRGLFSIEPDFALSATESPRFREFFDATKKKWEAEGRPGLVVDAAPTVKPVTIKHASPAEWQKDQELRISGDVDDAEGRVDAVEIRYRTGSKGKFSTAKARLGAGRFRAVVPGSAIQPPLVEYYIEAHNASGLPVASRGDATSPLRIAVPSPEEGGSVFASPWFWAGSAAVVGGVVAAILLTGNKTESTPGTPPQGSPTSRVVVVIGP